MRPLPPDRLISIDMSALRSPPNNFYDLYYNSLQTGNTDYERVNRSRFERSPMTYIDSPLDKPLPPLPTPATVELPIMRIPTPIDEQQSKARAPMFVGANNLWRQQYLRASLRGTWIDTLFAGQEIYFGRKDVGYAWKLEQKLSEKTETTSTQMYASAIYECSQTQGRVRGPKALVKVYMQIPQYCNTCESSCEVPLQIPERILDEIAALKLMSSTKGDVAGPRLLASKNKAQTRRMWVPGGFLTFVVMQRVPGRMLDINTFRSLPGGTQNEIRRSFKAALESLWQAGVMPRNGAIDKLTWNRTTGKCNIVDFEGAEIVHYPLHWWDDEYFRWGLAQPDFSRKEMPRFSDINTPADVINSKIKSAIDRAAISMSPTKLPQIGQIGNVPPTWMSPNG